MVMLVVLADGYGAGGGKGQCVGEGAVGVPSHPGARCSGPSSEDSGRIAKVGEDIRKPFENVNTQASVACHDFWFGNFEFFFSSVMISKSNLATTWGLAQGPVVRGVP